MFNDFPVSLSQQERLVFQGKMGQHLLDLSVFLFCFFFFFSLYLLSLFLSCCLIDGKFLMQSISVIFILLCVVGKQSGILSCFLVPVVAEAIIHQFSSFFFFFFFLLLSKTSQGDVIFWSPGIFTSSSLDINLNPRISVIHFVIQGFITSRSTLLMVSLFFTCRQPPFFVFCIAFFSVHTL